MRGLYTKLIVGLNWLLTVKPLTRSQREPKFTLNLSVSLPGVLQIYSVHQIDLVQISGARDRGNRRLSHYDREDLRGLVRLHAVLTHVKAPAEGMRSAQSIG